MKRFIPILILIVGFLAISPSSRADSSENEFNWSGHMVRGHLGGALDFVGWSNSSGMHNFIEPFFEYGYEYGFVLDERFYLSAGLSWSITYPRNFAPARGFFEPPLALWYTPLTYLQAGYIFPRNILLTAGLVYFWGGLVTLRFPFDDHFFFESKAIVWLDRIFDTRGAFGKGFDNAAVSIGIGYHF
jgi:hypothetical protein